MRPPVIPIALLTIVVGCGESPFGTTPGAPAGVADVADYVGAEACATCHTAAYDAWRESHHARAMQLATQDTVLGDFNDTSFTYNGVTTRFRRSGDSFTVETDGPMGKIESFAVRYTFGVAPLQQYLVELTPGRLQALSIAWDARPEGQRWFHLYPDEAVDHRDVLHWTKVSQNWSVMCADCHSTNVTKGFDPARGAFDTSYSAINVSCEACHGPGSLHVQTPQHAYGRAAGELDTCAPCHSRRVQIAEGYRPGRPD